MNINRSSLFWGILLIGAGILALGAQLGYFRDLTATAWILVFAALSLIGLVSYAMSGWSRWARLFPTGIFGGLALTLILLESGIDNAAVASSLFFGLTIPFSAAYLTDRRRNWWTLIAGGGMLFLAIVTLLVDSTSADEWIGALFLFVVAVSFFVVYLNSRMRWWALLVAYVTGVLGIAPLLSFGGRDAEYFASILLFAVALPFFVLYFRLPQHWWAIIPAGAVSAIGVIVTLAIAGLINDTSGGVYAFALLMAGMSATFAAIWLRDHKDWARILTFVHAVLAVVSIFFLSYYQTFWPDAFILGGVYLLYLALRKPKTF